MPKKIGERCSNETAVDGPAWVISVDMGYGHQRAAYPLKDIACERIITANNDKIISGKDKRIWENSRKFYEGISRIKHIPILGPFLFGLYDKLQLISPFFPFRDQSKPSFAAIRLERLIKKGFGRSLVSYVSKDDKPVITTHFIPSLMFDYDTEDNHKIYSIVTDTDINRVWVASNTKISRIVYFAPCKHVVFRLKQYGVPESNIIETGFPLPKENIGDNDEIVKKDLMARLVNLDPKGIFFEKYRGMLIDKLGLSKSQKFDAKSLERFKTHKLTITYTIGGAGAQKEIALEIIDSIKNRLLSEDIILNIVVGVKLDLKMFFEDELKKRDLDPKIGRSVNIIFAFDKKTLFSTTNKILRDTDILWTKPSEMSFYTALGLPIIIAPPIGAHEQYNKTWLEHIGSGFVQENPRFTQDWLYYWISDGRFADAAMQGFIDAPRRGTYNIEKYLKKHHPNKNI